MISVSSRCSVGLNLTYQDQLYLQLLRDCPLQNKVLGKFECLAKSVNSLPLVFRQKKYQQIQVNSHSQSFREGGGQVYRTVIDVYHLYRPLGHFLIADFTVNNWVSWSSRQVSHVNVRRNYKENDNLLYLKFRPEK